METAISRTRKNLFNAAQQLSKAGGTTTHILHTIARMTAGPTATPGQFEQETASVFDMAGFFYDDLSSEYERKTGATPYPHETAKFDDLIGDDQTKVIQHVINNFGEPDQPPALPIVLADELLNGLRKAAALKIEHGDTFIEVYYRVRVALFMLLLTQSITRELAIESIDHALATGKTIAEAVAHMDGQL
ncbi:hypothetical protein ACFV0L_18980 [Streptosporangium canum]|uniref:hypothetical protein n=1 Tax=Streptosporangium canum TaxID=324952 RepID=UPI0036B17D4B